MPSTSGKTGRYSVEAGEISVRDKGAGDVLPYRLRFQFFPNSRQYVHDILLDLAEEERPVRTVGRGCKHKHQDNRSAGFGNRKKKIFMQAVRLSGETLDSVPVHRPPDGTARYGYTENNG
jgi:hypothetical protein